MCEPSYRQLWRRTLVYREPYCTRLICARSASAYVVLQEKSIRQAPGHNVTRGTTRKNL